MGMLRKTTDLSIAGIRVFMRLGRFCADQSRFNYIAFIAVLVLCILGVAAFVMLMRLAYHLIAFITVLMIRAVLIAVFVMLVTFADKCKAIIAVLMLLNK